MPRLGYGYGYSSAFVSTIESASTLVVGCLKILFMCASFPPQLCTTLSFRMVLLHDSVLSGTLMGE